MAGVFLGLGTCPVCGSAKAKFSFSDASKLAYCTCNTCNVQVFARSDNSDARLRALVHPASEKTEPNPAPALDAQAPPAIEKVAEWASVRVPEKTEKPKAAPWTRAWGVLGHG